MPLRIFKARVTLRARIYGVELVTRPRCKASRQHACTYLQNLQLVHGDDMGSVLEDFHSYLFFRGITPARYVHAKLAAAADRNDHCIHEVLKTNVHAAGHHCT